MEAEGNTLDLKEGVVIAHRHIHASTEDAIKHKLKNGQVVKVKIDGPRGLILENVVVRVAPDFNWNLHLDTDEGNAAGVGKEVLFGEVIIK
jgi:putative phosphotransacetylase